MATANTHYENFPVVSFFTPKHLKKHVGVIYYFARTADDIADEGNISDSERLAQLNDYGTKLQKSLEGNGDSSFWIALANTITEKKLSPENFFNLLEAFKQDTTTKRYNNFTELLGYCKNSANPVGRIILELNGITSGEAFKYSDDICTALQLTNFYQDVKVDLEKDRIYIPLDELSKFNITEAKLFNKSFDDKDVGNFQKLMKFQCQRCNKMFHEGHKLVPFLNGMLKVQIKWTILGGEKILEKISKIDYNVVNLRPKLSKSEYLFLMIKAITGRV